MKQPRPVIPVVLTLVAAVFDHRRGQAITATATGSLTPPTAPPSDNVLNGDFLIAANLLAPITGDGIDEANSWTFDFTADPGYAAFPIGGSLASAKHTVTVKPGNLGITTDLVGVMDPTFTSFVAPGPVITPIIQTLSVDVASTVEIELLGFYSSADILNALAANGGHLPMLWHDDVILSFAQLTLVSAEASSILKGCVIEAIQQTKLDLTIRVRDQFGVSSVRPRHPRLLLVPAEKRHVTAEKRPDQVNDPETGTSFGCGD